MSLTKEIKSQIFNLLNRSGFHKSICPSEVAKQINPESWRSLMKDIHSIVDCMSEESLIHITQKGEVVSPQIRKGTYRIKKI